MADATKVWCAGSTACTDPNGKWLDQTADCPHGITNEAYIAAARMQARTICTLGAVDIAISIAMALWQRNASKDINDMQKDVSNEQMELAEKLHAHAKKFWTEEKDLVDDAFGEARTVTDYQGLSTGWHAVVSESLDQGREDWITEMQEMCFEPEVCEDMRWQRLTRLAEADTLSFAARQAEGRAQVLRDRRYERQYKALAMGKGILQSVVGYQSAASAVAQNAGGIINGTINSIANEVGYWMAYRQPSPWENLAAIQQTSKTMDHTPRTGRVTVRQSEVEEAPVMQTQVVRAPANSFDFTIPTSKDSLMSGISYTGAIQRYGKDKSWESLWLDYYETGRKGPR